MNNIQYDYIENYINKTHKKEESFFSELRKYAESNHIYIVKPQVEKLLSVILSIIKPQKIVLDKEKIALVTEYALHELCDANTNMLKLVVCLSKKQNLIKDTIRLLEEETKFNDFIKLKEQFKNDRKWT